MRCRSTRRWKGGGGWDGRCRKSWNAGSNVEDEDRRMMRCGSCGGMKKEERPMSKGWVTSVYNRPCMLHFTCIINIAKQLNTGCCGNGREMH